MARTATQIASGQRVLAKATADMTAFKKKRANLDPIAYSQPTAPAPVHAAPISRKPIVRA